MNAEHWCNLGPVVCGPVVREACGDGFGIVRRTPPPIRPLLSDLFRSSRGVSSYEGL
jgi:hypothetical protein